MDRPNSVTKFIDDYNYNAIDEDNARTWIIGLETRLAHSEWLETRNQELEAELKARPFEVYADDLTNEMEIWQTSSHGGSWVSSAVPAAGIFHTHVARYKPEDPGIERVRAVLKQHHAQVVFNADGSIKQEFRERIDLAEAIVAELDK